MTARELCERVLAHAQAEAQRSDICDCDFCVKAAPLLARMLLKAIEQRDAYINNLFIEVYGGSSGPATRECNAELDRIAANQE